MSSNHRLTLSLLCLESFGQFDHLSLLFIEQGLELPVLPLLLGSLVCDFFELPFDELKFIESLFLLDRRGHEPESG